MTERTHARTHTHTHTHFKIWLLIITVNYWKLATNSSTRSLVSWQNHLLYLVLNSSFICSFFFSCPLCSAAAAAKSLQSCPTLCDPMDGSPPGSPVPGILQARTLEWVAISFSNAWKWTMKVNHSVVSNSLRPHGLQPTGFLHPWDFPGKSTGWGAIALSSPLCSLPSISSSFYSVVLSCLFSIFLPLCAHQPISPLLLAMFVS